MQALFEVLSLEGWVEVRDVIIDRVEPVTTTNTTTWLILIHHWYYHTADTTTLLILLHRLYYHTADTTTTTDTTTLLIILPLWCYFTTDTTTLLILHTTDTTTTDTNTPLILLHRWYYYTADSWQQTDIVLVVSLVVKCSLHCTVEMLTNMAQTYFTNSSATGFHSSYIASDRSVLILPSSMLVSTGALHVL